MLRTLGLLGDLRASPDFATYPALAYSSRHHLSESVKIAEATDQSESDDNDSKEKELLRVDQFQLYASSSAPELFLGMDRTSNQYRVCANFCSIFLSRQL